METISTFSGHLLGSWVEVSVLVCVILLVQAIVRERLKPRWRWALWLVLVVRMVTPWAPESAFSVFNLGRMIRPQTEEALPVPQAETIAFLTAATSEDFGVQTAGEEEVFAEIVPATATATAEETSVPVPLMALLWLVGALGLALVTVVQSVRLATRSSRHRAVSDARVLGIFDECKKRMSIRHRIEVVESGEVLSPALVGLLRSRLFLPIGTTERLSDAEVRFVFLHELAHVKRWDIATNWLVTALQCVYWFHPLVWYAFYRMRADRELACDALALSYTQPGENAGYGRTILALTERLVRHRRLAGMVGILESGRNMKRRIAMIAMFEPGSHRLRVLPVALIALLGLVTLTNAQSPSPPDEKAVSAPNVAEDAESASSAEAASDAEVSGEAPVEERAEVRGEDSLNPEARPFLDEAKKYIRAEEYDKACESLVKVLQIDPGNDYAGMLYGMVSSRLAEVENARGAAEELKKQAKMNALREQILKEFEWDKRNPAMTLDERDATLEARRAEREAALLAGREASRPSRVPQTPPVSQQTSEPQVPQPTPEMQEVEKKLAKRLPYFDFTDQPLTALAELLSRAGDVNIVVDPVAVPLETKVTLLLEDASIKSILDLISVQTGVDWAIVDNYVYVSDEAGIAKLKSRGPQATAELGLEEQQVMSKLSKRIAHVDFRKQPLASMLSFLRTAGKVNIVLDPNAYAAENEVTVTIENASIRSLLDLVTAQVFLDWDIVENYIYISDDVGVAALKSRGPGAAVKSTSTEKAIVKIRNNDLTVGRGASGLCMATVHLANRGSATSPVFTVVFSAVGQGGRGRAVDGIHSVGPIKPGGTWNETTGLFALEVGEDRLVVEVDTGREMGPAQNALQSIPGIGEGGESGGGSSEDSAGGG